ncbi:MAG: hypothetical protein CL912_30930 [Deltaproteobacteria bacterium]|nr:hypothetical protein [Deltaproteobacteria bacterium]|tara:strand:+ start:401 stop:1045 length:645 start_codon:yes stop_codon:yes gene_type:complete
MLRCRIAVPSLLQVNRESRIEMLKHYTAPAHIPGVPDRRPALSQYYFDPTIEIVVFRSYIHLLSLEEHMNAAEDIFVAESLATLQSSIIGSTWWSVPWKFFDPISTSTPDTPPYYRHSRNNQVRFFRTLSSLRDLVLVGGSCALKYDYQRALCVKSLTAMFKEFRHQDPGRGEVEVIVLMKCHRPGTLECEECWVGFSEEKFRAKLLRAVLSGS